ncbi:MAG: zeta toxin family protein [Blastocatellia bacterium]|nr:zeta toxin family protein [Blastocatellia bacterium]
MGPPRLRMFAGPNGSGKTTMKSVLRPELLGVYINPDDIEREICTRDFLDLRGYQVSTTKEEILDFFRRSSLLEKAELLDDVEFLGFGDDKLVFHNVAGNSYFASVAADFLRTKLIQTCTSFTFETVMSAPDKVEVLRKAQFRGYRTYLYFVATNDPAINISRVRHRVKMGGHPVPEDKIRSRYERSLDLLMDALQHSNRAYLFDNSQSHLIWLAEITDGKTLELKTDLMPAWFNRAVWEKFKSDK